MPLAYGIESYRADGVPGVATENYTLAARHGSLQNEKAMVGFAFGGGDDRAYELLARLFENGINVWCSKKPFHAGTVDLPRGSFLIRRAGNPSLDVANLRSMAEAAGISVIGVDQGLAAGQYADLGGNDFVLLKAPRIAVIAGTRINGNDFGALWHLIDSRLRMRMSTLDIVNVDDADLSKYNVIVLPDAGGGASAYKGGLGDGGIENLKAFAKSGGTLIGEGGGAAFLADSSVAISSARNRSQVLKDVEKYTRAVTLSRTAFTPDVDSLSVWEGKSAEKPKSEKNAKDKDKDKDKEKPESPDTDAIKRADEMARKLYPHGAIVAVDVNTEHWLGYGCNSVVPAILNSPLALVTENVEVPARLAPASRLRLSGLLWEEARARWAESVYVARDSYGEGQAIVFTAIPNFRGYYHGAERMLLNALFLGPGFGTAARVNW
jgi:hypothetical protein